MPQKNDLLKLYFKWSKNLNTFPFLFFYKISVNRARNHKMHVEMTIREDPDQTVS